MNHLFFAIGCFIFLFVHMSLPQYKPVPAEQQYKVVLSEGSKLSIVGKTNINHFQCKYTEAIKPDVLQVSVRTAEDGLYFSNACIHLQTIHFKCGPSQMNQDLQDLLKEKEFPQATIRLLKIRLTKEQMMQKSLLTALSEMEITLAGVTKRYSIPVSISTSGEEHLLNGTLDLNICDFNLEPPVVMMGLIRVKEEVKINFKLKACIEKTIIHQ